jgi:DNA-binding NarL/FixJ family response regulator
MNASNHYAHNQSLSVLTMHLEAVPETHRVPYRILIVDDVAAVRESLRWLLEDEGDLNVVGEASDGAEALDAALATMPDLVLLDMELPRVHGTLVARRLRELPTPPAIIFMSIHNDEAHRRAGLAAGCDAYVDKNDGWPTLILQMRRVLASRTSN